MRDISELIGLIKSIDYDHIINDKEVERIKNWVDKNRNLAYDKQRVDMISLLDDVLEDRIITEDEKRDILIQAEKILNESNADYNCIYELRGIIEGIVCDEKVNEREIYGLKTWLETNNDFVRSNKVSAKVYSIIEEVLEDEIITEDEQALLLEELNNYVSEIRLETKIDYLRKKVRQHNNIGLELISLLDNETAIDAINKKAESQLRGALNSYTGTSMEDPEIVFISLCLIGMIGYDGSFYDSVREYYSDLYDEFSEQKIEGRIRSIIYSFRDNKDSQENQKRIITTVLKQSIVPAYFLDSFFEFIFDIYKLNFDYELPDNPYEDFAFAFAGLKNNMTEGGDDLKVNVTRKTYKLIKSTKELIADDKQIDSVINLSIIVARLIDKKIWQSSPELSNIYLKQGYEKWEEQFEIRQETRGRRKKEKGLISRWKPNYYIKDNAIYIIPPNHRIKSTYNYQDIRVVVYNGEELIYSEEAPDIREIIGGYQISVDSIEIQKPLGKIHYMLVAGNDVIYDSKEDLYRDYIVFGQEGLELKNNTNYSGVVVICGNDGCIDLDPFYSTYNYNLYQKAVEREDVLQLNGDAFGFSSLVKPGVFGKQLKSHFLKDVIKEELIPVYSYVDQLVFECKEKPEDITITLNSVKTNLIEYEYKSVDRKSAIKYIVELHLEKPDIYNITVEGKSKQIASFNFAWDDEFYTETYKLNDTRYYFKLTSSLTEKVEKELTISNYDYEWLKIRNRGKEYAYIIPLQVKMYQIDDAFIKPFSEELWIEEIGYESKIRFFGVDADSVMVYSDKGKVIQEPFLIKQKEYYLEMSAAFLLTYRQTNEMIYIYLVKEEKAVDLLVCYNQCSIIEDETEISHDPITGKLKVRPAFHGKGNVTMRILNSRGEEVFVKERIKSGVSFGLKGLKSFRDYTITFNEAQKGLLLGKKERTIYSTTMSFITWSEMVGRSFRIKEVYYDRFWKGEYKRDIHYFNNVYVHMSNKLAEDVFEGEIYIRKKDKEYYTHHINPVRIEICSNVMDDEMELSMTKEGDGLLLDMKHHQVMNTMDNDRAPDIYSYIIDVRGAK